MTGLLNKLESLGAKIEEYAVAAGRDVETVYEEIVAHIEGKKAEATAPKPGDVADTGHSHIVEDPGHTHTITDPANAAGTATDSVGASTAGTTSAGLTEAPAAGTATETDTSGTGAAS